MCLLPMYASVHSDFSQLNAGDERRNNIQSTSRTLFFKYGVRHEAFVAPCHRRSAIRSN